MRVEIWSDVVCPWCHVGKSRFEEALRRLGWDDDDIEVVFRPFELDRRVPPGGLDLRTTSSEVRHGGVDPGDRGPGQRGRRRAGPRLRVVKARRANTFDAHRLLEWAVTPPARPPSSG